MRPVDFDSGFFSIFLPKDESPHLKYSFTAEIAEDAENLNHRLTQINTDDT
jgi:hypothetical protein